MGRFPLNRSLLRELDLLLGYTATRRWIAQEFFEPWFFVFQRWLGFPFDKLEALGGAPEPPSCGSRGSASEENRIRWTSVRDRPNLRRVVVPSGTALVRFQVHPSRGGDFPANRLHTRTRGRGSGRAGVGGGCRGNGAALQPPGWRGVLAPTLNLPYPPRGKSCPRDERAKAAATEMPSQRVCSTFHAAGTRRSPSLGQIRVHVQSSWHEEDAPCR